MRMSQHNDMENIKDKITGNDGDDNWAQLKRMAPMIKMTRTLKRRRWTGNGRRIGGDILTASQPSHASGPF